MKRWETGATVGVVVLLTLLTGLLAMRRFGDYDALWHVCTGRWIFEHGRIPFTDPFGSVTYGAPWIDVAWAAQIVMAALAGATGLFGVQLAAAILAAATLAVVLAASPRTPPVLVGALLMVLAVWPRLLVRPDLLTFPLVVVAILLVDRQPRHPASATLALGLLAASWANLHGSFVLLPLLTGAATLGAVASPSESRGVRARALGFAVSAIAPVANPYGVRVWALFEPYVASWLALLGFAPPTERLPISEWAPTWRLLFEPDVVLSRVALVSLVLLIAASFALAGRHASVPRIAMAGVVTVLAALAARNVLPFAAAVLTLVWLNERDRSERESGAAHGAVARAIDAPVLRVISAVAVAMVAGYYAWSALTDRLYVRLDLPYRTGAGVDLELVPEGAVRWVASHRCPGLVFNNFDSGAYLLYRLYPEFAPYVDARVVSAEFFRDVQRAGREPERFEDLVGREGIGTVILVHPSAESLRLLPHLAQDPRWTLAFRDHNSTIHVRVDLGPPAERSEPFSLPPAAEPAAGRFNRWLDRFKGPVLPAAELTDAFVSRQMGDGAREEAAYRRALERDPGNSRALAYFRSPRIERPAGD